MIGESKKFAKQILFKLIQYLSLLEVKKSQYIHSTLAGGKKGGGETVHAVPLAVHLAKWRLVRSGRAKQQL